MKHQLYLSQLCLVIGLFFGTFTFAQTVEVDFSQIHGFGVASDRILMNHILVRQTAENADGLKAEPVVDEIGVTFKACQFGFGGRLLYLMPVVSPDEPPCQIDIDSNVDLSHSHAFSLGFDRVQIENIAVKTFDHNVPEAHEVIVPQNVTFHFDPITLNLEQILPSSSRIEISLDWGRTRLELDAHLTGPAFGAWESYNNERDRFHLYFGNKFADVAVLHVDDNFTKPQFLTLFPPPNLEFLREGVYRFTVHHSAGRGSIAQADAQVRLNLWGGEHSLGEYLFVPPFRGQVKSKDDMESWIVFELQVFNDGITLGPTKQSYEVNVTPPEVRRRGRD
jgi:hypothetical protein